MVVVKSLHQQMLKLMVGSKICELQQNNKLYVAKHTKTANILITITPFVGAEFEFKTQNWNRGYIKQQSSTTVCSQYQYKEQNFKPKQTFLSIYAKQVIVQSTQLPRC